LVIIRFSMHSMHECMHYHLSPKGLIYRLIENSEGNYSSRVDGMHTYQNALDALLVWRQISKRCLNKNYRSGASSHGGGQSIEEGRRSV